MAMRWSLFRLLKQRSLFLVVMCLFSGLYALKSGHLKVWCHPLPRGQVVDWLIDPLLFSGLCFECLQRL